VPEYKVSSEPGLSLLVALVYCLVSKLAAVGESRYVT